MSPIFHRPATGIRRIALAGLVAAALTVSAAAAAEPEEYKLDPAHTFITFSISHLGYSFIEGRFNDLEGELTYDPESPADSTVTMTVQTESIDTNHAERDRHLRGGDFLDVEAYPEARFETTRFEPSGEGEEDGTLTGELTLHGETRTIEVDVTFVGAGEDPRGDYRRGYVGTTTIDRTEFGIDEDLGPDANELDLKFVLEGIRQ